MYMVFGLGRQPNRPPGGIRLTWAEEIGWSYAFLDVRGQVLPRAPVVPLEVEPECERNVPRPCFTAGRGHRGLP